MDNLSGKVNYLDQMHPREKGEIQEEPVFTLTKEDIIPVVHLHEELKTVCKDLYDKRKLKVINDINIVLGMIDKDIQILKQNLN